MDSKSTTTQPDNLYQVGDFVRTLMTPVIPKPDLDCQRVQIIIAKHDYGAKKFYTIVDFGFVSPSQTFFKEWEYTCEEKFVTRLDNIYEKLSSSHKIFDHIKEML